MTQNTIPTDAEVAAMSPLDRLSACYADCPPPMQQYLDRCIGEAVPTWLGRAEALIGLGYRLDVTEALGMEDTYVEGMKRIDEHLPDADKLFDATNRDCVQSIAQEIDESISRTLLGETVMNREAYMDIVSGHALIARGLTGLLQLPPEGNEDESVIQTL